MSKWKYNKQVSPRCRKKLLPTAAASNHSRQRPIAIGLAGG